LNQPLAPPTDATKGKTDSTTDNPGASTDPTQTIVTATAAATLPAAIDASAAIAAQGVLAAQAAATPQTGVGTTTNSDTSGTTKAVDALTSEPSKPKPLVTTTPMERAIAMAAKPAGSQLKTDTAPKGKHAAEASQEFDAKTAQPSEKKLSSEAAPIEGQAVHLDGATISHADTEMHAARMASQQAPAPAVNPAVTALANQSPAALTQVQAAAAQMAETLTPRVGTQDWNQALGQKVVWMANGEQQSASLTLNPPDLGPLQVVLSVTNNHATANFTAAQPEVRQALESAMPKLREMLADAGIQLGQANVSTGTPNQQQHAFNAPSQQSPRQSARSSDSSDAPVRVARVQPAKGGVGMVDTFA